MGLPRRPSDRSPGPGAGPFPGRHRHPFLLVDRPGPGGAYSVRLRSAGDRLPGAAAGAFPASLLLEVMAQGALWVLAGGAGADAVGEGEPVHLAGIDSARFHTAVRVGDRLTVHAEPLGGFGALSKVSCRVERGGEVVAEARLLLVGPDRRRHGS